MVVSVQFGGIYQVLDPDSGRFFGRSANRELAEQHRAAINERRERQQADAFARNAEVRDRAMGRAR